MRPSTPAATASSLSASASPSSASRTPAPTSPPKAGGAPFTAIAARATRRWNQALGRIRVSGGSRRHLVTFYTALYHALLAPRTFNDVNGAYPGMDGAVHRVHGRTQYADLSGWDVYRTQVPLLAMLVPKRAGDIARSLLADAAQSGCLPRWSYANGQSMTMVGDSADPMLAAADAFGAPLRPRRRPGGDGPRGERTLPEP